MYVNARANGLDSQLPKNSVAWDFAFYATQNAFLRRDGFSQLRKDFTLRVLREERYRHSVLGIQGSVIYSSMQAEVDYLLNITLTSFEYFKELEQQLYL
jgi:hypothetical protein